MIVLVKPRHGDLQPTADGQMQPLRQWKAAQYESWRQEDLFFPVQCPGRPKRGILLNHRPDFSLDPVIGGGIEDNRTTQDTRAAGWKVCANRALNVHRPQAFRCCESGGQDGVPKAVRCSS